MFRVAGRCGPAVRCQAGFSLLEVLVAFTILALTLGVLHAIFSNGMRAGALSDDYTYAMLFAESRLASVGSDIRARKAEVSGTEAGRYRWHLRVEPYRDGASGPVVPYVATIEIRWADGNIERSLDMSTLVLGHR